jgi:hypothetical protein
MSVSVLVLAVVLRPKVKVKVPCPSFYTFPSATSGPMGNGAAILFAHWSLERMFVVALKRAGFAVSWSRTASWEIPTHLFYFQLSLNIFILNLA